MAAGKDNLAVRDGGVWKTVDSPHVRDGGVWKEADELWVRDAGTWKQSYKKSDPFVRVLNASDSGSWNWYDAWTGSDLYPRQQSWGAGDNIGCIAFDLSIIQGDLAVRPNVTSATLRLTRLDPDDGYNPGTGLRVRALNRTDVTAGALNRSVIPDYTDAYADYGNFYKGATNEVPILTGFVEGMGWTGGGFFPFTYGGLVLFASSSGPTSPDSNDLQYMSFEKYNSSTAVRPRLTYTCDY